MALLLVIAFLWYVALSCLSYGALATPPTDIPNVLYYNTQNTTSDSDLLKNLNRVLTTLIEHNTSESTFASGIYPNTVYGSSECYSSHCVECLTAIASHFRSICPLAVGAREYRKSASYQCYLRYEMYDFLPGNPNAIQCMPENSTQGTLFTSTLDTLLGNLTSRALHGPLVASSGPSSNLIYGTANCYNTVAAYCSECLSSIRNEFRATCPLAVGAQKLVNTSSSYMCFLQYKSVSPQLSSDVGKITATSEKSRENSNMIISIVVPSSAVLFVVAGCMGIFMLRKRYKVKQPGPAFYFSGDPEGNFSYDELRIATENFQECRKLGQGGFGAVYKGTLADGREVAIKRLHLESERGKQDFSNEVKIVSSIQHRNLVRMHGYCAAGHESLLVLEYVNNGTLEQALHVRKLDLDWPARREIILGIARGLAYLHEESHKLIIHRDIKGSNILLDDQLDPKISDFGISKPLDRDGSSNTTTRIIGTFGYIAPEYALHGELTAKADVFSFGMLTLEIVSGRRLNDQAFPTDQRFLLDWSWQQHLGKQLENIVDPALDVRSDSSKAEALRMLHIALLCTQPKAEGRPQMSKVVTILTDDHLELPPLPILRTSELDGLLARFASGQSTTITTDLGKGV